MDGMRRRCRLGTGARAAAAVLVLAAAGTPGALLADLLAALTTGSTSATAAIPAAGSPGDVAGDSLVAVVAVLGLAAWALAGWSTAVALLLLAGRAPGTLGCLARRACRVVAPAVLQRGVAVLLGLSVVVAAAPAHAHDTADAGPGRALATSAATGLPDTGAAIDLDWPADPGLTAPAHAAEPTAPTAPAPPGRGDGGVVMVQPGDSLWRLAERSLGPAASPARVAATWPSWWSANRAAVGADPDLIQPGTRLVPPLG